ncbi:MAG: helix-turn-helix transcriptional regulator [Syntrophomonas sp.]
MKRIDNHISTVRKELGITQKELARNVGITRPYLSDIENCKRQVSGEVMIRIARFLKVNVEEIFFASDVQHAVRKQNEN